ncbi:M14 family zinc carboxypeptidase [Marinicella sediminis]|uniref:M14 family zinc carboxypeptidase n=1 Tax=Marinicella sediminis TaxID=1792834 RepID=A0ABV7JCT0_9GAMM|nr:M14 family zinc carboxypeptidase [Marinicella sediminis]
MIRRIKKIQIAGILLISIAANSQTIVPWTEQNSTLGLGYPVPIPVNTPEPFDGFRTYEGLFAKHQSMAMSNEMITGHVVGQTHYERDVWAYVLSDPDNTTRYGVKEGAMMVNGGIHAREWQSPETLTQIITDFHDHSDDASFYQYLLENATIITIPVNNIDGFLQTQRYPSQNWYSNTQGPRDGRMRRKNLLNTDEDLFSQGDHLNGVDLNRNNRPYWATSGSSSGDPTSIVYHGPFVQTEPETQARLNAAELIDADQLRIYTDVHSFSMVHFANRTFNANLNTLQSRVLGDFSSHHRSFPAAKNYVDRSGFTTAGFGIGTTDEYFQTTYQIPSWTLEIEPSGTLNPDAHPHLPGVGADYGGFANNGHDGFILPESEIKRVREQLAQSFMVIWYGQAGPPSISQMRIIDLVNNNIVYDAEWDITETGERALHEQYFDEITAGKDYALLLRFDKPMRWRDDNDNIAWLQGQSTALNPAIQGLHNNEPIELSLSNGRWINTRDTGWASYGFYKDDTYVTDFNIDPAINAADDANLTWKIITTDMIGQNIDANPQTVATWAEGQWQNYENSDGAPSINGGFDTTLRMLVSNQDDEFSAAFAGTGLYYDPARDGEGFNLEAISDNEGVLLQWFTYDDEGQQQWYVDAQLRSANNALHATDITTASGGVFGPGFDPDAVTRSTHGDIEIIFNETLTNRFGSAWFKYTAPNGDKFRSELFQLTEPAGKVFADPDPDPVPTALTAETITGSWYDPERDGEGFHIEYLNNGTALFLWYTFGPDGSKKWFQGSGGVVTESDDNINVVFDTVVRTEGPVFGPDFNPEAVIFTIWGEVEFNLQCLTGSVSFTSNDDTYGAGSYQLIPITKPSDIINRCD